MPQESNHLYKFGDFRLDTNEKIFLSGEEQIELTPKAFELLTFFVENPGRLLKKEEIMEKIWAESFVEESNLTFNIGQLRKVLRDDAQQPKFIKTVRQHGYRFIAPVEIVNQKPIPKIGEISKTVSESTDESFANQISRPNFVFIALALLLIAGLIGALFLYGFFGRKKINAPILQTAFKSEKLTNTGGIFNAVISPDGQQMAYTSSNGGKTGVWVRQLETSENVQVVPNSDDYYFDLRFSHDGKNLYFSRGKRDQNRTIFRVSAMGGIPKEIVSETYYSFSLTPDDKQISFSRCQFNDDDFCSLFVADSDGKNEQKVLTRPRPIVIWANEFSPDGKSIAVAMGQTREGKQDVSLIEIDPKTRTERQISKQKFYVVGYLRWLSDKKGIIFTAYEKYYRPYKIYLASMDSGEITTLTEDSNDYRQISLDNSFQKMIATRTAPDYRLWVAPTDSPTAAKPICSAQNGTTFAPNGKIFYTSISDGIHNIWSINSDGTDQRQLTSNQEVNRIPRVSPDERYIYFASNRTGSYQIWRMNLDGSSQTQISDGEGGLPIFVSRDGNSVYFETSINSNLAKVTVNSDGTKTTSVISNEKMTAPSINYAETTVAYFSKIVNQSFALNLMSLADGKIVKTFPLPEKDLSPVKTFWEHNGESIFYLTKNGSQKIIWKLSIQNGKVEKFLEYNGDEEIEDMVISADGKTFAFIRGKWEHDAYLISGLK